MLEQPYAVEVSRKRAPQLCRLAWLPTHDEDSPEPLLQAAYALRHRGWSNAKCSGGSLEGAFADHCGDGRDGGIVEHDEAVLHHAKKNKFHSSAGPRHDCGMTNTIAAFFSGFVLSAALITAIGAQNLFVLRQGLRREHVGAIVLFCGLADALLIMAGVAGVGAFLAAIPQITTALSLGGAAFLTWYGVTALRRMGSAQSMVIAEAGGVTLRRALGATAAFTFLNPHVYLDTVLLMGAAGSVQSADMRPIFVAGAATASFSWFAALGYSARLLRPVFAKPAAWRVLDAVIGVVMLGLAASLVARVMPVVG